MRYIKYNISGNEVYNPEETFYLNLLLHNFSYVLICAVCQQKKPGKNLKVRTLLTAECRLQTMLV